jgi:hypothetical protein
MLKGVAKNKSETSQRVLAFDRPLRNPFLQRYMHARRDTKVSV